MVIYFKKYVIAICVIAVAVPVVVSTIYPMVTGQIMASTIGGLITLLLLFFISMLIAFNFFERKAEGITERYIDLYNDKCDPEAMVREAGSLAASITFPCNEEGAWFIGYYAQALLDMGKVEEAKQIDAGLRMSIQAAKKPLQKVRILVNLVQLNEKLDSLDASLELIEAGLKIVYGSTQPAAIQRRDFLLSQKKIIEARKSVDQKYIIGLDDAVKTNSFYPMRVRVEYAFDEARAYSKLGDSQQEKSNLEFVIKNGNKLALVQKAKDKLDGIADAAY